MFNADVSFSVKGPPAKGLLDLHKRRRVSYYSDEDYVPDPDSDDYAKKNDVTSNRQRSRVKPGKIVDLDSRNVEI